MSSNRKALLVIIDAARRDDAYAAFAQSGLPALAGAATTDLIAPSCWTLPTIASTLTGLYPAEHDMTWQNAGGRCHAPTIADMLAEAGRSFRLLSGNHIYAPPTMRLPRTPAHASRWQRCRPAAFLGRMLGLMDYGGRGMVREVRRMTEGDELPDLLMLHLQEPHHPYLAPPRGLDPRGRLRYGLGHLAYYLTRSSQAWEFAAEADDRAWAAQRARYRECLAWAVGAVEDVLRAYERAGALDDALVIVTADHGEHFGEHGLAGHQASLHDELVHCPCAIMAPGMEPGRAIPGQFQHTDLLVTICNFLSVACAHYEPRSEPLDLLGSPGGREQAFTQWTAWRPEDLAKLQRRNPGYDFTPLNRDLSAIRTDRWKYIAASDGLETLYDLRADHDEVRNRVNDRPQVAAAMRSALAGWLDTMGADHTAPQRELHETTSRIRERRLRDLGYI